MVKNKGIKKRVLNSIALVIGCIGGSLLFSEMAFAKFDINAASVAASEPLINALEAHWGKVLLITSSTAGLFGEGDGIQRIKRAGGFAIAGGAGILGLLALLK